MIFRLLLLNFPLQLGTKVGVKVGVAAARYDALRKNVLFGGKCERWEGFCNILNASRLEN